MKKTILLTLAFVAGMFATDNTARRGFNILPALCAVCFAVIISGAAFADSHLSPLHQAVVDGNFTEVQRHIDDGADVNAKGKGGLTALHGAAGKGYTKIARALIGAGADVNAKSMLGATPLHLAAAGNKTKMVLYLVKYGADVNMKANNGYTAFDVNIRLYGENSNIALFLYGAMQMQGDEARQKAGELLRELE